MKQFNEYQTISLIQSVGKILGASLATYGVQVQNLWAAIIGVVVAVIALWFSHHSNATLPPAGPDAAVQADSAPKASKLPPVILCGLLAAGMALSGCVSGDSYKVRTGILPNGIGWHEVVTATNGVKTTNSFKFTIPVNITNAIPLIEEAF